MNRHSFYIAAFFVVAALGGHVIANPAIQPGDRIAIVGNTFADQLRIHGYLETLLLQHSDVSIRNLGWGGDMLTARDRPTGFPTEVSTLTEHKTDVIIACFGMGESFSGSEGVEGFRSDLKAFVESHRGKIYNGESKVRLVLVSPIAYENHGKLTPALEKRNRDLEAYTTAMGEVATEAKLPFVDLFEPSQYLMRESQKAKLTTNGIHLNSFGYWAISHTFFEQLVNSPTEPWRLNVNAKTLEASATGVKLTEPKREGKTLTFSVTEQSTPSLSPQVNAVIPPQLDVKRDLLVVRELDPGKFTLTIDGEQIITASAEEWARGVSIDTSPAHRELDAIRAAINDKNLQFTYSWKALNQVHIVGERRNSSSGRALPTEVIEFNKLAKERDQELGKLWKPKTRQWRLAPAEP